jgi:hypothetical protein
VSARGRRLGVPGAECRLPGRLPAPRQRAGPIADTALSRVAQQWCGCSNTSQFAVATCFDTTKVGVFTSLPEHYAQWKTTAPVPERMRRPDSAWRSCRRSSACSRAFCTPRLLNPRAALRAVHAAGGPWPGARPEGVGRLAAGPVVVEGPGSPGISERHGSGPPYGVGHKLQEASAILPGCACSPQGVVGKGGRSAMETNALFSARSGWPTVSLHCDPSRTHNDLYGRPQPAERSSLFAHRTAAMRASLKS